MGFISERRVAAVRKARLCDVCYVMIETGQTAINWAGMVDGDFATSTFHPDCREAEVALNVAAGSHGDEWYLLRDEEAKDCEWLLDEFPDVYDRMFARPHP
jgi:hypothetical protein